MAERLALQDGLVVYDDVRFDVRRVLRRYVADVLPRIAGFHREGRPCASRYGLHRAERVDVVGLSARYLDLFGPAAYCGRQSYRSAQYGHLVDFDGSRVVGKRYQSAYLSVSGSVYRYGGGKAVLSGRSLRALRSGGSGSACCACFALRALLALRTLYALYALWALRACGAGSACVALRTLLALLSLQTLFALRALYALLALRALRSLYRAAVLERNRIQRHAYLHMAV